MSILEIFVLTLFTVIIFTAPLVMSDERFKKDKLSKTFRIVFFACIAFISYTLLS